MKQSSPKNRAEFFREGEYWTLTYQGEVLRLKESKGLDLLAVLIRNPDSEFDVIDLLTLTERADRNQSPPSDVHVDREFSRIDHSLGDAGEMLDKEAKASYRRRISELREDLERAKAHGEIERAEAAEGEIDFLTQELSRAVGLRGRDRRAGSASERARLSVTRAVRSALAKVTELHRPLGEVLNRAVRTGRFCSYSSRISGHIEWSFEPTQAPPVHNLVAETAEEPNAASGLFDVERTEFVGRDAERSALLKILDKVERGAGTMVLISGASGVGKTRLAAEVGAVALKREMRVFRGHCYEEQDAPPYSPFAEIFEMALSGAGAPAAFRAALGEQLPEWIQLIPHLRHYIPDIPPPPEIPEHPRYYLFNGITQFMSRVAADRPLVLVVEDLHWADESTLQLLAHLVRRLSGVRVLMLATSRDSDMNLNRPLTRALEEFQRKHLLTRVRLKGLSEADAHEMLSALSGQKPPAELARKIYRETEGNPFFVEEVFKHLQEVGKLLDADGRFRTDLKRDEIEVPETVRAITGLRISRLHVETRQALAAAAVIGRNFTFEVLRGVVENNLEDLLSSMEEAESAGLISSSLRTREAFFTFSHELVRQTLLGAQSPPRQQRLHLKVAEAIEREYAGELEDHFADLAYHLWRAGAFAETNKTARYLALAGEQAMQRSAYEQALSYLTSALDLMHKLPDDQGHVRRELDISIALSLALQASKGLAAPEHEPLNARMLELSQRLEERDQSFSVLALLWSFFLTRGDLISARKTSHQIIDIAHGFNEPLMLTHGNLALGMTLFYQGELADARRHLEQAMAFDSPVRVQRRYAADPRILCLCHLAWTMWFLGFPDQALAQTQRAISVAREIGEPFGITYATWFGATVHELRGEWKESQTLSDDTLARAENQGFPEFAALGALWRGTAMVAQGAAEPGLAQMREGAATFFAANHGLGATAIMGNLAKAMLTTGRVDEALATLDDAFGLAGRTGEQFFVSELHRLRGEGLLARGPAEYARALECFETACASARAQGGRSLELRARLSLAGLRRKNGDQVGARKALIEILDSFSEGFQTSDLKLAKSVAEWGS